MNKSKARRLGKLVERERTISEKRLQNKIKKTFRGIKAKIGFKIDWEKFEKELKIILTTHAKTTLNTELNFFSRLYSKELENKAIEIVTRKINIGYIEEIGTKVKDIKETTKSQIERIITEGREKGLKMEEISQNISKEVNGMSITRARTIANTEVGDLRAKIDNDLATETKMEYKTWLHTGVAKRDRSNHARLDMKKIPMNEEFDLGNGIKALYPHDPKLPPEETINCHCMIIYE